MALDWPVESFRGSASELHGLAVEPGAPATIWILEVTGPAVVLGSTQSLEVVDQAAAARRGVEVVRRRSGGGAVWVAAGDPVWVDVVVPRGHRLWSDDVGHSFLPIGQAWGRALAAVGVAEAGDLDVHAGPMVSSGWSSLVCFAGLGPGEVLHGGRKVVGISQRRTRDAARFQCALPRVWDPRPLIGLLDSTGFPAGDPLSALVAVGSGIGDVGVADLVEAFADALTERPDRTS